MADADSKNKIEAEIARIEVAMADPSFWQDKADAQKTVARYHELKGELEGVGKYDKGEAIITIFSGAGGDDAEDFSRMLYEMYQKYCARVGFATSLIHENQNDHKGFRNVTFQVSGNGAYGILKNESGVHRLVRVSPFNAKGLRHTSFSLVEVIPKLANPPAGGRNYIPADEMKIEVARAGGI